MTHPIVRLTAKGRPLQKPVAIHGQPIEALLENLKHPVDGVRHRTRVELSARDSESVIAATRQWMKDFDPNDPKGEKKAASGSSSTGTKPKKTSKKAAADLDSLLEAGLKKGKK